MMRAVTSQKTHEAHDIPLAARVDYMTIIASMAGADVSLAPEEMAKLRELCGALELPERETQHILDTAHRPTASIERHLDTLKSSPLRFSQHTATMGAAQREAGSRAMAACSRQ